MAKTVEQAETTALMHQRMKDLEQSIQVLRTFKQLYRSTAEFKCAGCLKSFKPVLFKAHHLTCAKLLESTTSTDERLFVKIVEVKVTQLRLVVSHQGQEWTLRTSLEDYLSLLTGL